MQPVLRLSVILLLISLPAAGMATLVPNPEMSTPDGKEERLLAPEGLTVFVFFDPSGSHSREVLAQIAGIQEKMQAESIRWTGILSDRFDSAAAVALLRDSDVHLAMLIDSGDHLYGQLKVRLYPTVGITDPDGLLRAYLPYMRANFDSSLEAHLLHALGRIDDAQLAKALEPRAMEVNSTPAEVSRMLKLAAILWRKDRREKALEMAQKAVETAPDSAEAQAVLGLYLADGGQCGEALPHLEKALTLDPDNKENAAVLSHCTQGG